MQAVSKSAVLDARFILKAIKAWCLSALFFLIIGTACINGIPSWHSCMGYVSSAVSFISAVFAGAAAARSAHAGQGFYAAALSAAVITTILLSVGFLICGASLPASGVLSVVSFTFSGSLSGAVFFGRGNSRKKHRLGRKFT